MSKEDEKRAFFAFKVIAPWPEVYPRGRLLQEEDRHLTMAFLGNASKEALQSLLTDFPAPPFAVGRVGVFDGPLCLPGSKMPRAFAWHSHFLENEAVLNQFQRSLISYLIGKGFSVEKRNFLPHVTLCRAPFSPASWKKAFRPLPMALTAFSLYESLGNLQYRPLQSRFLQSPFREIEHVADIAFRVYGETKAQIYLHAAIALAFKYPELVSYFSPFEEPFSLEEIVQKLNDLIGRADVERGCPFKAVSYHGDIEEENGYLSWEMIVDV